MNKGLESKPRFLPGEVDIHELEEIESEELNQEESIEFDLGEILDPVTQTMVQLKGKIPQLGSYSHSNPAKLVEIENFLTDYLINVLDIPWREDQMSGESSYVNCAVSMIGAFNSLDTIEMDAAIGASFFAICFLYTDDILNKMVMSGRSAISSKIFSIVTDIIQGKYKEIEELDKISPIPALDPIMKLVFVGAKFMCKSNSNFDTQSQYFCKAFKKDWEATLLMKDIEGCSDEAYKILRGRDVAARTTIEIGLLLHKVDLGQELRSNVVLKLLLQLIAGTVGLVNDLLGLRKELGEGDMNNLVLRNLNRDKIPLAQAFAQVLTLVQKQMADIKFLGQKLKEDFSESQSVQDLLMVIQNYLNGHVYFYDCNPRYGSIKSK